MIYRWLGFEPGESFGAVLGRHRGVGPGFDLLRILLAVTIFCGHAIWATGGGWGLAITAVADAATHVGANDAHAVWTGPLKPIKLTLVPGFFALSGFLVMGSAIRLRATSTFLAHRALRIFPALIVEVVLSAFLLGATLTVLPFADYVRNPDTWHYLTNIVGVINYVLPGVFVKNPVEQIVNISLWTLPSEFYCYLLMAVAMVTTLAYRRTALTVVVAGAAIFLAVRHALTGASNPQGPYPTHVIVYYFFLGALFYHWRDRIPARFGWFVVAIPAAYALLMFDQFIYVAPFALVYAILFFGLLPVPKLAVISGGDYSYGIYLYGFPVTQALVFLFPGVFVGHAIFLIPAGLAATIAVAVLSWHGIERHALGLKKRLPVSLFPTRRVERDFQTVPT